MTHSERGGVGTAWGSDVPTPPDRYDSLGRRHGPQNKAFQSLPKADLRWQEKAACSDPAVDPAWFFSNNPADVDAALTICDQCPVVAECRLEREQLDIHGVWGGQHWVYTSGRLHLATRMTTTTPFTRNQRLRREKVLELVDAGWSPREIGEELGVTARTVLNDLRALEAS